MPEETPAPELGGGDVVGGVDPQDAVKNPATFLLVVGGIGVLVALISLLMNLLGAGLGAAGGGDQAAGAMLSGGIGIVFAILGAIGSVVVILGSLKMKNLENYGLSMAAAIIAMLPIASGCCLLGLPAGIWCIIVLMKPEIKAAFKQ